MKEDFTINGKPAYATFGVRLGSGCIDAIEAPLELKDVIENEDRRENGVRQIVRTTFKKRTVTLKFRIHGTTTSEYLAHKKAFETELYGGIHKIQITDRTEYYHLVYTGKSVSYNHSYNGKFGEVTMQFIEPNPANRSETPNENVTKA